MRGMLNDWPMTVKGFNPRPANWPGDAHKAPLWGKQTVVSIRARPIGRAMLSPISFKLPGINVSIRARPIGRAMQWGTT